VGEPILSRPVGWRHSAALVGAAGNRHPEKTLTLRSLSDRRVRHERSHLRSVVMSAAEAMACRPQALRQRYDRRVNLESGSQLGHSWI
jgi:hypothetical protein